MGSLCVRVALAALLLAGLWGWLDQRDRVDPWHLRIQPRGSFWQVERQAQPVDVLQQRGPGLLLPAGARLQTQGPAPSSLAVSAVRPDAPCGLELSFPCSDGGEVLARVWPDEPFRLEILARDRAGEVRSLASGDAPLPGPGELAPGHPRQIFAGLSRYVGFRVDAVWRHSTLELALLGVPLLSAETATTPSGPPALTALDADLTLIELSVRSSSGPPLNEPFAHLPPAPLGTQAWALDRLALPLLAVLLLGAVLAAQCRRAPGPGPLLDATLLVLAPAALVLLLGSWLGQTSPTWVLAVALLAGLPLALLRLRAAGALVEETPSRSVRQMLVAGLVAAFCVTMLGSARSHYLQPLLQAEQQALTTPLAPAPAPPDSLRLDRGNALHLPGPFRDLELNARVTLGPGAILELRTRAADPDSATGLALFVPADDVPGPPTATSAGARWIWEDAGLFVPLGEPGTRAPVGRPFELRVHALGRTLLAWVDGGIPASREGREPKPSARMGSLRHPSGDVVLLAARGEVLVQNLTLTPLPARDSPDPRAAAWRSACLPLLLAILLGLLGQHLLGQPPGPALLRQVLAIVPLPLALLGSDDGTVEASALGWASVAAVALSALPALLARAGTLRKLLALLGGALLLPAAFSAAVVLPVPLDGRAVNSLSYVDVHAEPLAADRLHLEHPLLRRWNPWLARHRFHGREITAEPTPGVPRVLVLGGSSTWGYHVPEAAGLDWPTRLGDLVKTPNGGEVEVLNAAWPGATLGRITLFLQHELLALRPDLVLVCLGYNDSFALGRPDEDQWLARRLRSGTAWTGWERSSDERLEAQARWASQRALVMPPVSGADTGLAQAFTRGLDHLVQLCHSANVEVLLVVEPWAPGASVRHLDALAGALLELAAERGVPAVDPRAALSGPSAQPLFMDVIHPTVEGHRRMAEAVAPAVQAALPTPGAAGER